jgi:periplasmic divalent cation tolerance protein
VNVVPGLVSTYRWQGRIERTREVLLVIKTTGGCAARCRHALERAHPYDVPEVVVLRPEQVSAAYARWVDASTRKAKT